MNDFIGWEILMEKRGERETVYDDAQIRIVAENSILKLYFVVTPYFYRATLKLKF